MLIDVAKQTEPTTEQQLRRGQKRKAEISSGETWDNLKRHHNEGANEEREDELRQGRRVYEIQGTRQAGYILNLRNTHRIRGTIQMTEQEMPSQGNGDLEEQILDCLTDNKPDSWEAPVDFWAGTSQDEEQEADTATATDSTQSDTVRNTAAILEPETERTPATDSTRAQTGNVSAEKSETEKEWYLQSAQERKKVRKSKYQNLWGRNELSVDDLITGAPSAPQGKRTRLVVDYTP
jgi:hypothetical protein